MIERQLSERQALCLWRDVLVASVRSDSPDLTARQQAILFTVCLSAGPHTVRGLASALNVAKPAITRAVDALVKLNLVRRVKDMQDLRNVFIERTPDATASLRAFAALIQSAGQVSAEEGEPRTGTATRKGGA
jgi:DNA-binding MarR family transcriptional regulator